MIVDERMVTYINSLDTGSGEFLDRLELQARKDRVPIIRREMQSFLKVLLQIKRPARILEVGTAVGFSALLMAKYTPEDTRIVTVEKYEKRIPIAKENFRAGGMEHRITLLEGDALEILKGMNDTFDFIFMDAAKGQYIHFYPEVMRLLEQGECWFRIMSCRREILLNPILQWNVETARFIKECGIIFIY